jgi:hypothetical protein
LLGSLPTPNQEYLERSEGDPVEAATARTRVQSGGEELNLEVSGEHFNEIESLGDGFEVAPGLAAEGIRRDAECGADGVLALVRLPGRRGGDSDRSPNG